jgi:imidazole glycerol-phosphate synthase subunit HisH
MIAIIQYNAGNTASVQHALTRLGYKSRITGEEALIRRAEKVIFPGVGEAGSAMLYLQNKGLDKLLQTLQQPVLGICLGLQLMCRQTEESGVSGLGIFSAGVHKILPDVTVPHMGWNNIGATKGSLFREVPGDADFYFVHSYAAAICEETTATCLYGGPFSAALQKDNFYAVQFHPEKSAAAGEQLLRNFLQL